MIVIWLFVFKNLFKVLVNKEESLPINLTEQKKINFNPVKKHAFHLIKLKRDPFRGSKFNVIKREGNVKREKVHKNDKVISIKEVKDTPWPKLNYYGFVKKNDKKKRLALLKIDGKLIRVREKSIINLGIKIISIYKDSIITKRQGEVKTILRD